jgi:hypothetical protein
VVADPQPLGRQRIIQRVGKPAESLETAAWFAAEATIYERICFGRQVIALSLQHRGSGGQTPQRRLPKTNRAGRQMANEQLK